MLTAVGMALATRKGTGYYRVSDLIANAHCSVCLSLLPCPPNSGQRDSLGEINVTIGYAADPKQVAAR